MTKIDKLIKRLKSYPKDFTYDELKTILNAFGYTESNKGKTSGSRVIFIKTAADGSVLKIILHKPHPQNILKEYSIKDILDKLRENGDLKWMIF